jgi:hypothetical protein
VEPVLGLVKAAAREVALGDELMAAVLAARFDDVVLASLLLEEDAVVMPEMLAEVELGEGKMLPDENGALAIIPEVEKDRLLLVLELDEDEVLTVELSTNDGGMLLEVEEAETLAKLLTIAKLLELDNEDRTSEPDNRVAVLMLEEVSVLESVIRVTSEDETVLVVSSVPELEKVPDARPEVTVGSTAAELVAKSKVNATAWLKIGAVVERGVVAGTVVARAESLAANVVVLLG